MKKFMLSVAMFFAVTASAKHFGAAGCGLGSVVMGKHGNQVMAATTNGTGIQTSGITSGTSNCVDHGSRKMSLVPYVETNKQQLLSEMAKGSGESLAGLAQLMGCRNHRGLNAVLQRAVPGTANADLTDHIYQAARRENSQLQCGIYL